MNTLTVSVARLGVGALALALLAGCAGMPNVAIPIPLPGGMTVTTSQVSQLAESAQTATKTYTEAEEIQLGEDLAQGLLGAAPLLPNPGVQRYVNQVGRWLASQTERPNLPWRFGVLDNEHVNAFAAPGGQILMTSGLLNRLNSESELAGVLAHEIAHVLQKHQLDAIAALGKAGVAKGLGQIAGEHALSRAGTGTRTAASVLGGPEAIAGLIVDGFYARPLDRSLEYDADRMGVIIAARAGYDPYGFITVLQMMESLAKDSPFFALINKTHPSPTDRITELEKIASTLDRYQNGDQGAQRFAAALGRAAQPASRPATAPAQQRPAARPPAKAPAPAKTAPAK